MGMTYTSSCPMGGGHLALLFGVKLLNICFLIKSAVRKEK